MNDQIYSSAASAHEMLNAFESKLAMLKSDNQVQSSTKIEGGFSELLHDMYDEPDESELWVKVDHKYVEDTNGFTTDYTLWYNEETEEWCTIFGDNDLYHPWDSDHDMDFETEEEARDWFWEY